MNRFDQLSMNFFKPTLVLVLSLFCIQFGFSHSNIKLNLIWQKQDTAQQQINKEDIQLNKADSLFRKREYEESLKVALRVLDDAKQNKDDLLITRSNFLIGKIWYRTKSYSKGLKYLRLSLRNFHLLGEENGDSSLNYSIASDIDLLTLRNTFTLGTLYHRLYEETSKDLAKEAIYKDSTLIYYNQVIESDYSNDDIKLLKSKAYSNLSGIMSRDERYDISESYLQKALSLKKELKDTLGMAYALNNISNTFFFKKDYQKSKETLLKAIALVNDKQGSRAEILGVDLYFNLAYSLYMLKDYEAYTYLEKSYILNDEIEENEKQKILEEINAKHNYDLGVLFGKQQEELKRQKTTRNSWIIGTISLLIILSLAFLLILNRLRRKNLRLALEQKDKDLEIIKLDSKISGQEEERKRISLELHDGVLSKLFGSRMGLGLLELKTDKETQSNFDNLLNELKDIEKEIRDVSHQLKKNSRIESLSFTENIDQMINSTFRNGKVKVETHFDSTDIWNNLENTLEGNLIKMIQEILQNIIKHAKATEVNLSFTHDKNNFIIRVKDNGIGFDPKKSKKGIGLSNMQLRIDKFNGSLKIKSVINKGTQVLITIPKK